jgi:hypothetical protein
MPATVPVWNAILEALFENTARLLFGGIEKFTVLPPVENCMEGSSLATSAFEVNFRVNWPEIGVG